MEPINVAQVKNYKNPTTSRPNQSREKNSERLPPKGRPTSNTMTELNPVAVSSPPTRKLTLPQPSTTPSISSFQLLSPSSPSNSQARSQYSNIEPTLPSNSSTTNEIISVNLPYPSSAQSSPLSKHLAQLFPPNDVAINFFNSNIFSVKLY